MNSRNCNHSIERNDDRILLADGSDVARRSASLAESSQPLTVQGPGPGPGPDIPAQAPVEAPLQQPPESPYSSPEEHPDSRPGEQDDTPQEVPPQRQGSIEQ